MAVYPPAPVPRAILSEADTAKGLAERFCAQLTSAPDYSGAASPLDRDSASAGLSSSPHWLAHQGSANGPTAASAAAAAAALLKPAPAAVPGSTAPAELRPLKALGGAVYALWEGLGHAGGDHSGVSPKKPGSQQDLLGQSQARSLQSLAAQQQLQQIQQQMDFEFRALEACLAQVRLIMMSEVARNSVQELQSAVWTSF